MDDGDLSQLLAYIMACIRAAVGGLIYWVVLMIAGAGIIKSLLVATVMFICLGLGIGRALLQSLAMAAVLLLLLDWCNLVPTLRWSHDAMAMLDGYLSTSTMAASQLHP